MALSWLRRVWSALDKDALAGWKSETQSQDDSKRTFEDLLVDFLCSLWGHCLGFVEEGLCGQHE